MPTKDFTVFKVAWLTQLPGDNSSVEEIHAIYRSLINFLQKNKLTVRQILHGGENINDDSHLMRSDLTDNGFKVYQKAEQKWMRAIDRGGDPNDMTIFEKALANL